MEGEILERTPFTTVINNTKYLRGLLTKQRELCDGQNIVSEERDGRRCQKKEKPLMLMVLWDKHSENGHHAKSNSTESPPILQHS